MGAYWFTAATSFANPAATIRALTLLDLFTREALAIEVDQGITGETVAGVLDAVIAVR